MEKSAFIAIVGRPNAGKSSILNALLGEKVAIVTDKPQTTRTRITGVLTAGDTQLVFVDTPGLHRPKTRLGEQMVKAVHHSLADVDAVLLVADCAQPVGDAERELQKSAEKAGLPVILALNKIDLVKAKAELLPVIERYSALGEFREVIPLSARTGDGLPALLASLGSFAVPSPHFFPDDALTDQPERILIAEYIREKVMLQTREELPHGIAVAIEQMRESSAGTTHIDAVIIIEKQSHKGMIIGKGGSRLREIGTAARLDIEQILGAKVNLKLWVKLKEDWRNRDGLIREFGLND